MRTKFIFILALIMGLITTYFFYSYIHQIELEKNADKKTVEIVVAAKNIKKDQIITKSMLKTKEIAENSIPPKSIKEISSVIGMLADCDIIQDEPILEHRINKQIEEDLLVSRKIKEGYRAVSVGVNIVQSLNNLIEPEDYVDVIFSEEVENELGEKVIETEMILKDIRVLAVGRRMIELDDNTEYTEYTSVTLELNAQDSVKLVNTQERGNIQFAVRSRIDY